MKVFDKACTRLKVVDNFKRSEYQRVRPNQISKSFGAASGAIIVGEADAGPRCVEVLGREKGVVPI